MKERAAEDDTRDDNSHDPDIDATSDSDEDDPETPAAAASTARSRSPVAQAAKPGSSTFTPETGRYSFIRERDTVRFDSEEMRFWFDRLFTRVPPNHDFVRALRRGIGVHHAGLSKHKKDIVEV